MRFLSSFTSDKTKRIASGAIYYFSIALSLFIFFFLLKNYGFGQGPDMDVFCKAGGVIRRGGNPYLVAELGTTLSWNYLPIYALAFRVLCSRLTFLETYPIWYSVLFLLSLEIWANHKTWLYGLVITATGLFALGSVLQSGNLGVIELALISLSAFWLLRGYLRAAFFSLGMVASLKLFPLLYIPVFFLILRDWKSRRSALVWGAIGFLLPFLLSALWRPDLLPWYFRQLMGLIPNQHAPIYEGGGDNPSLFFMFTDLFSVNISHSAQMTLSILFLLLICALLYLLWHKFLPQIPPMYRDEFTIGLGIVVMTLLMPRIKSYSFLPALLFVYVLSRNVSLLRRALVLLLISILPQAIVIAGKAGLVEEIARSSPVILIEKLLFLQNYFQPFFLSLILVLIFLWARSRVLYPKPSEEEPSA